MVEIIFLILLIVTRIISGPIVTVYNGMMEIIILGLREVEHLDGVQDIKLILHHYTQMNGFFYQVLPILNKIQLKFISTMS